MGENLASEVIQFFQDDENTADEITRITFIGHSMGGIIIRWALPYLSKFKNLMHGFWTLSSPHLGYATWKSKLVKAGLWFMDKWSKTKSIQQLSMSDTK